MIDTQNGLAPSGKKVLVIEDHRETAELLSAVLVEAGYRVWLALTGADGERLFGDVQPDLVLLDLVLPDADGLVLCAQVRSRWNGPVILISGTQRQRDRVLGLKLGADDFISKPFDISELLARIEAVLRRTSPSQQQGRESSRSGHEPLSVGEFTIDRARRVATVASRPIDLTPTEFQILGLMASRPGDVFSRQELASALWDRVDLSKSRAIDVHIRRLRQKLQDFPHAPVIATVWGYGYKLDATNSA